MLQNPQVCFNEVFLEKNASDRKLMIEGTLRGASEAKVKSTPVVPFLGHTHEHNEKLLEYGESY